jgi:radical SAM superfamily enzyme YgiQ (UPF0313 family)
MATVLLVNPNRMRPLVAPLALDYLADALTQHGHRAVIADLALEADLRRAVREAAPDLIGVSVRAIDSGDSRDPRFQLPEIRGIVAMLKTQSEAPVVIGGAGVSVAPDLVRGYVGADQAISGDGEEPLVRLAGGGQPVAGRLRLGDRSFVDNEAYGRLPGAVGIRTRSGCSRTCTFCVERCTPMSVRPPEEVAEEAARLGIRRFWIADSEMNIPDADSAAAVCQAFIRRKLDIEWIAYMDVNTFDDPLAEAMAKSGGVQAVFGVDGGCDEMMAAYKKGFGVADVLKVRDLCRRHRITPRFELLLGGPGETAETVDAAMKLIDQLPRGCVAVNVGVRVYPGTPIARELGWKDEDLIEPRFYVDPRARDSLERLQKALVI